MATGYRSSSRLANAQGASGRTFAFPAGTTTDDVVVVYANCWQDPDAAFTWTISGGTGSWQSTPALSTSYVGDTGVIRLAVFVFRASGASAGNITVGGWAGSQWTEACAVTISGIPNTVALADLAVTPNFAAQGAAATAYPAVSITTGASDPALVWFGDSYNAGAHTPPTSFTERVDGSECISAATRLPAASGTYTTTGGTGTHANGRGAAILLAIVNAASGTSYTPSPSDPVGVTDSASATLTGSSSVADPVGATDSAATALSRAVTVSDSVGITDTGAEQAISYAQTSADAVGVGDSATTVSARVVTITDGVGATDSAARAIAAARAVSDGVGVTDSATGSTAGAGEANPSDPVGLTDSVSATLARVVTISDPVGATDSASGSLAGAGSATVNDSAGVTDSITIALSRVVTVADLLGLIDAPDADLVPPMAPTPADPIGVSDGVTLTMSRVRTVADGLAVIDAASLVAAGLRPPPERTEITRAEDRVEITPREDRIERS